MKTAITRDSSNPKNRGKRLKYIREHLLNISRSEFCKNTDINAQSLKGWELAWGGGLTEKGAEKFVKRTETLGIYCSTAWLLHDIGYQPIHITDDLDISKSEDEQIAKELLLFREQPGAIDTVISDDGMIPFFYPKDYVAGLVTKDFGMAIGKQCIVITDSDHIYVRTLQLSDKPGHYDLVCLNKYTSLNDITIENKKTRVVAPIVWIRKRNSK